eukprot:Skav226282  [mRNA]  locus=scaffold3301:83585:106858:+ [translate_table: standard]
MSRGQSKESGKEDSLTLSVEFEGLLITVSGASDRALDFVRRLSAGGDFTGFGRHDEGGQPSSSSQSSQQGSSVVDFVPLPLPRHLLPLGRVLHSAKYTSQERLERAWKAGQFAGAYRSGTISEDEAMEIVPLYSDDGECGFHPYVLDPGGDRLVEAVGRPCLAFVALKREHGLLVALPSDAVVEEHRSLAQQAEPMDLLGPSKQIEVAGAAMDFSLPLAEPMDVDVQVKVLLMDFSVDIAGYLKPIEGYQLEDVRMFADDDGIIPRVGVLLEEVDRWVSNASQDNRVAYYSAEEEAVPEIPPVDPEEAVPPRTPKARARAKAGTTTGGDPPRTAKEEAHGGLPCRNLGAGFGSSSRDHAAAAGPLAAHSQHGGELTPQPHISIEKATWQLCFGWIAENLSPPGLLCAADAPTEKYCTTSCGLFCCQVRRGGCRRVGNGQAGGRWEPFRVCPCDVATVPSLECSGGTTGRIDCGSDPRPGVQQQFYEQPGSSKQSEVAVGVGFEERTLLSLGDDKHGQENATIDACRPPLDRTPRPRSLRHQIPGEVWRIWQGEGVWPFSVACCLGDGPSTSRELRCGEGLGCALDGVLGAVRTGPGEDRPWTFDDTGGGTTPVGLHQPIPGSGGEAAGLCSIGGPTLDHNKLAVPEGAGHHHHSPRRSLPAKQPCKEPRASKPRTKRDSKEERKGWWKEAEGGGGTSRMNMAFQDPVVSLNTTFTFRQFCACLPRWILSSRSPFASFLARSMHAQPSCFSTSSTVYPIPLPEHGLFRGSGPKLTKKKWWSLCRRRVLHVLVVALNYLHAGQKQFGLEELGRRPSALHRAIYRRLEALITVSDTPGELPLPPGRAGPEFIARLFDLEAFAAKHEVGPMNSYEDGIFGGPARIPAAEKYVPNEPFTPFAPYHSLVADRIKITGTGKWDIASFLEDDLWLPYQEPKVLSLDQRPAVGPSFRRESYDENLKLAKIWDAKGLLAVFDEAPRFRCRVFGAHKSSLVDRQIGDRRWCNQHEYHLQGPSAWLPSGNAICALHCPKGFLLRGCISDRKDFYHQCQASRARAFTNCLPFRFPKSDLEDTKAFADFRAELGRPTSRSEQGDRLGMGKKLKTKEADIKFLYAGFKSLYQGDHLGVEYAFAGHQQMLAESGVLCPENQILRNRPFPRGLQWTGLVIDDLFIISAEHITTPVAEAWSVGLLRKAEATYGKHEVLGSDEKTVVGADRFKVIGAEVASDSKSRGAGVVTVGAPVEKRCALAALSLRTTRLPIISKGLASRIAGGWMSVMMFRRQLSCVLGDVFSLGSTTSSDSDEVISFPRKAADEVVLASVLSLVALTDISVPYSKKVYATDASLNRGAVTSKEISEKLAASIWLGGDKRGCYTKLENDFRATLRSKGIEVEDEEPMPLKEAFPGVQNQKPAPSLDFAFDFVEVCGGSGTLSKAVAAKGYTVCPPIDLSSSKHYDLRDLDLVWWIFGMLKGGRFRSVAVEPTCTTFSPAQHPASRSYPEPYGFDRLDPKTYLGNLLAFRCFAILWVAAQNGRPALLEQPRLSKMTRLSIWKFLVNWGSHECVLASCQFGSIHRKEFKMLVHGLPHDRMNVHCRGGHQHVRIEGKYTKDSAIYVPALADFLAECFTESLEKLQNERAPERANQHESVVLNDLLSTDGWEVESCWNWRYPSHINVFESYSNVYLLKRLTQDGGDIRFTTLLDSRVAKGAHAKGRSSSSSLRTSLKKACSYVIAGNLHPSYGFAPTRLNTADAPTRYKELPEPSRIAILDFLSENQIATLHSFQFSRAAAGWIRLFILLSFCTCPGLSLELHPVSTPNGFWTFSHDCGFGLCWCGWFLLCLLWTTFWILRCVRVPRFWTSSVALVLSCFLLRGEPIPQKVVNYGEHPGSSFTFPPLCAAMPLTAGTAEDAKRAARRAGIELHADRVLKPRTRNYREGLLEQFGIWLAEHFQITLQDILQSSFEAETVSDILVAYGKDLFYSGRAYGRFAETINSLTARRPSLRKQVAAAWDLAFCWVADEPHEHHPALPLTILLAISGLAMLWGWIKEASIILMTWSGLLRIGESLAATRAELILPSDAAPGVVSALLRVLQPKTRGRAAKHQCAKIDFPDVVALLEAVYAKVDRADRLWPHSPQLLRKRFGQLQVALGLDPKRHGQHVPYDLASLRPGGATFLLQLTEDAEQVRRKGRWLSSRVLEIYVQEASVSTFQTRLTSESRAKIQALAYEFPRILTKATFLLGAGIPPRAWPCMWYEAENGSLVVLDTIGLGDTEIDQSKWQLSCRGELEMARSLNARNGVDCLLYVMRNARITDDAIAPCTEMARLIYVTEYLWGDESLLNLYIVVTYASKYANNRQEAESLAARAAMREGLAMLVRSSVTITISFIFVDNPDLESVEPRVDERRRSSRESLYKLFCSNHPRDAVPPFTQAMMKQVTYPPKLAQEKELRGLEASAKSKTKKTSVTGVDYKKAQIAMQVRLKEVKSDKDFQAAAQQHAETATDRFMTDFKGDCERAKAASRRLNLNSQAAAKASAKPTKSAGKAKAAAAPVRQANKESPAALFRNLGGWTGAGAISPMIFTSFMLKHVPDITQQQIGALWWRADTNNDGQVDLNEFKDFFAKYVEVQGLPASVVEGKRDLFVITALSADYCCISLASHGIGSSKTL